MAGISSQAAGGLENRYKYNGIELQNQEFSDGSGLEEYAAFYRDLDPQTGRWWQVDPEIENMEMWSPYASNYDNPILYKDPRGNEGEACCGGIWTAIKKTVGEVNALVVGAVNAWGSDQVLGAGSKSAEEAGFTGDEATFYNAGQTTGHGAAVITGAIEVVAGGGSEVLTVGGSTAVSVPVALHGASSIVTGFKKLLFAQHTKNARPSTEQTHQEGQARKKQDRQGSKGMTQPPRKRPPNHKGPWPPKPPTPPVKPPKTN
jgi:RHS repeat-associated protein